MQNQSLIQLQYAHYLNEKTVDHLNNMLGDYRKDSNDAINT